MKKEWIYKGDFRVTKDMVSNGMLIKELIPREVTGDFSCFELELTSLEGCPKSVSRSFDCDSNLLQSLEGGPKSIGKHFECSNNNLTTLEGCPKSVGGVFTCSFNQLSSLEGSPNIVNGNFYCYDNKLVSLEYTPKNFSNIIYVNISLKIEKDFIESRQYKDKYWLDLLKYMTSNHIYLTKVKGWPDGFINSLEPKHRNILISAKGISKFQL